MSSTKTHLLQLLYSIRRLHSCFIFFFFNDTSTTEIYTLSLHDALPISLAAGHRHDVLHARQRDLLGASPGGLHDGSPRSEEHTSELQSRRDLVCRLLLEKKKEKAISNYVTASDPVIVD